MRRRGKNFASACFVVKSHIKMHWHELSDTPVVSEFLSLVRQRSARTALENFFNISVSSARGRAATTRLVFIRHFTYFKMIEALVHLCFTHGVILKSFHELCDSFSCSFPLKETKFHTHSFFKISHFSYKINHQTHWQTLRIYSSKNDMKLAVQCHMAD
jgi:hypothetical protein